MANTNPLSTPCTAPGCTAIGAEPCYSCLIDGVVMIHAKRLAAIVEAAERKQMELDCERLDKCFGRGCDPGNMLAHAWAKDHPEGMEITAKIKEAQGE